MADCGADGGRSGNAVSPNFAQAAGLDRGCCCPLHFRAASRLAGSERLSDSRICRQFPQRQDGGQSARAVSLHAVSANESADVSDLADGNRLGRSR